jgi:hypothetical protein
MFILIYQRYICFKIFGEVMQSDKEVDESLFCRVPIGVTNKLDKLAAEECVKRGTMIAKLLDFYIEGGGLDPIKIAKSLIDRSNGDAGTARKLLLPHIRSIWSDFNTSSRTPEQAWKLYDSVRKNISNWRNKDDSISYCNEIPTDINNSCD